MNFAIDVVEFIEQKPFIERIKCVASVRLFWKKKIIEEWALSRKKG